MKKELTWFMQSFDLQDSVRYNVRYTANSNVEPHGIDFTATNTELCTNAGLHTRDTWDERDIMDIHLQKTGEVITLAEPTQAVSPATNPQTVEEG